MLKTDVLKLFGGNQASAARVLGITRSAMNQWPEVLDLRKIDWVLGAAYRLQIPIPEELMDDIRSRSVPSKQISDHDAA